MVDRQVYFRSSGMYIYAYVVQSIKRKHCFAEKVTGYKFQWRGCWRSMAESLHMVLAQWIQYKLGKQYL